MKLLKSKFNCSDEFDVSGWTIMDDHFFQKWLDSIPEEFDVTFYVGTNDELYVRGKASYLSGIKVVDITDEEAKTLERLFSIYDRGEFLDVTERLF